jgi:hypothetical protein
LRANSFEENFQKHVDCSVIDSYVNRGDHERRYVFPASPEYEEYETMENRRNFLNIKRKMNLEGRNEMMYFIALVAHKGVKSVFRKSMSQRRK